VTPAKPLAALVSALTLMLPLQSEARVAHVKPATIEGTWVLTSETRNGQAETPTPGRDWLVIARSGSTWAVSGAMTDEPGLKVRVADAHNSGISIVFAYAGGRNTTLACRLSDGQLRCAEDTTGSERATGEVVFRRRI